jgi:K+-sensing histidine kinase KdpD
VQDNATKYVMPDSELFVAFIVDDRKLKVIFDMFSLPIPDDELPRIGEEGFSGSVPQSLGLAGHGLGMFRAKRLLAANDAEILIKPDIAPNRATKRGGTEYRENQIIIILNESPERGRKITSVSRR